MVRIVICHWTLSLSTAATDAFVRPFAIGAPRQKGVLLALEPSKVFRAALGANCLLLAPSSSGKHGGRLLRELVGS